MPLRVCVAGVTGWAGRAVAEADDAADDLELVAGVSRSNQASLCGLSAADYQEIDARALQQQVGVIAAGNFSLTAALLLRFAAEAARHLASWEVIDYASAGKADAPSGTWRELAERLDAIRSPTVAVPV